jgi:hypothetical protein
MGDGLRSGRIPVFLLSFLLLSTRIEASGGQRKGFILGGGLGAGYVTSASNYSWESWERHTFAAAANLKAGYAPSNSLELYLFGNGWIIGGESARGPGRPGWDVIGVAGVGVTKYLSRTGSGPFVTGGLGVSFFNFERDGVGPDLGFLLGAGCDLSKHLSLQGDIVFAGISHRDWETAWGFRVTLNYLVF